MDAGQCDGELQWDPGCTILGYPSGKLPRDNALLVPSQRYLFGKENVILMIMVRIEPNGKSSLQLDLGWRLGVESLHLAVESFV